MSRTLKTTLLTGVLVGGLAAGPATAGAMGDCAWRPRVLPVPVGGPASGVVGADARGWLAGFARLSDPNRPDLPVIWRGGQATVLEAPFGENITGQSVNAAGEMSGSSYPPEGLAHGVVYRDGVWHRLPDSGLISYAEDINVRGDIVGLDYLSDRTRMVVWPRGDLTPPREFPSPDGEFIAAGPRIDDDGTVAGWTFASDGRSGYVWAPNGTRVRLAPLIPGGDVMVKDIRNGRVVGEAEGPDGFVGAEWDSSGGLVRSFPGRESVVGVNRDGWVLGNAVPYDGAPLVWRGVGRPKRLAIPDGYREIIETSSINDYQVGGAALRNDGLISAIAWEWTCS